MDSAHQRGLNQRHCPFFPPKPSLKSGANVALNQLSPFFLHVMTERPVFACQSHEHKSIDPGVRIAHVVQPVFHFFLYITKKHTRCRVLCYLFLRFRGWRTKFGSLKPGLLLRQDSALFSIDNTGSYGAETSLPCPSGHEDKSLDWQPLRLDPAQEPKLSWEEVISFWLPWLLGLHLQLLQYHRPSAGCGCVLSLRSDSCVGSLPFHYLPPQCPSECQQSRSFPVQDSISISQLPLCQLRQNWHCRIPLSMWQVLCSIMRWCRDANRHFRFRLVLQQADLLRSIHAKSKSVGRVRPCQAECELDLAWWKPWPFHPEDPSHVMSCPSTSTVKPWCIPKAVQLSLISWKSSYPCTATKFPSAT